MHYAKHKPQGVGDHFIRKVEMKYGIIEHDISKFTYCYGCMLDL